VFRDTSKDDRISAEVAAPPSKPRRAIRPLVSATTRPVTVVVANPAPRRAQPMQDSEPSVVIQDSAPEPVAPPSGSAQVPPVATTPPKTASPEKRAAGKWTELISASMQTGTKPRAVPAPAPAEAVAQPELGAPTKSPPAQPIAHGNHRSGAAGADSVPAPARMSAIELTRLLERQKKRTWIVLGGGLAVLLGVAMWAWLSLERPSSLPQPPVASASANREVAAAAPSASVATETEDADAVLPSEALPLEQPSDRGRGRHRRPVTGGRTAPTPVASFPPSPAAAPAPGTPKTPIVRHAPF
jgi:hypothetical protein